MTPGLILAGNPGAIEMPVRTVWRITDGYSYERRWWGEANAVRAIQSSKTGVLVGATSITFDQQAGSPIGILTATYSGKPGNAANQVETVQERMTIAFSDQSLPLHLNPTFIDIPTSYIVILENLAKDHKPNTETVGNPAYEYYELRLRGQDNYRAKLPVVTWTRTVGDRYPVALDVEMAGYLLSTKKLVDFVGAPVIWRIPANNIAVKGPDDTLPFAPKYTPGWMMDISTDFTGDGKIQINISAEFGIWANASYKFY